MDLYSDIRVMFHRNLHQDTFQFEADALPER